MRSNAAPFFGLTPYRPFGPSFGHTLMQPLRFPDEGGEGGEGGDGGEGGGGEGGDGGEGEGVQAIDLKDDATVKIGGKTYKVADLSAAVSSKAAYDGTVRTVGELLKRSQGQGGGQGQGRGGQQQQRQGGQGQGGGRGDGGQGGGRLTKQDAKDAISSLESMEILSGKDVASALREIETGVLSPVLKAMIGLGQKVQRLEQGMGRLDTERGSVEFDGDVEKAIKTLGLPQFKSAVAGSEVLNDLARNLFLSYDDADQPRLRGEQFNKEFKAHFDGLRKYFRALETADVAHKREENKRRIFARPGQSSGTNGKKRQVLTNDQVADALFAGDGPSV